LAILFHIFTSGGSNEETAIGQRNPRPSLPGSYGMHRPRRSGMTVDPDWGGLQKGIAGDVVLPGSPDYDAVRKPFVAQFHGVRPQAVVLCESANDVAETLRLAVRSEMQTVPRSGGHCFAGRSSSEGIVIDVTPLRSVSVSDGVATIGAGARLGDVYASLHQRGLTLPAGSCPSVGIAGFTLGGGLGILGRKYGVTSDQLLAAQIVLADGRFVDCDDDHDRELFWALRGAGAGNFGVVTSLVFRTHPASPATNFHLSWSFTQAAAVIEAWQQWAPAAPDELYASVLVTASAEIERPPAIDLLGSMLGSEADTRELLNEFLARTGADPTSAFHKHMSREETTRYWAELEVTDRDDPGQEETSQHESLFLKSEFFRRPLPTEAIRQLLRNLADGRLQGQSRELDFSPWGGAYNRVRDDATAFVHRHELFSLKHATTVDAASPNEAKAPAQRWLTESWKSARPWGSGHVFPNFPDPTLEGWQRAYYGTNYDRLLKVKRTYDPDNIFRFHQSLPSTA
jgi:FAD/FMN-containing dehydrogenase